MKKFRAIQTVGLLTVVFLCLILLAVPRHAARGGGTVYQGDPSNYRSLLDNLQPGDTLELAAGTYSEGLPLFDLNGTAVAPIIIRGPATGTRAVFTARACCNTVDIQDASYIKIYNLELDGQQLAGVDAVKAGGDQTSNWAHHITLENLYIHDHDASQQTVGISTKIPAWDWVIRRNVIDGAGTGMYLGNSDGGAPFVNGLIEGNLVMNTVGYNVQVKHQNGRTAVPGMPTADGKTIIRHNVFSKATGASFGGDARPNLLVGHWPLSGSGANDVYEIYGNFFYQNPTGEPLFQGEGNLALYDNLFFDDGANGEGIWIQPHIDVPRLVAVFNNTIVTTDFGVRVTGVDTGTGQWVYGNAIFTAVPLSLDGAVQTAANVTDSFANAGSYLVNPTGAPGSASDPLDLYPLAGALTGAPFDTSSFQNFTDWNLDFNRIAHDGTFRGAYAGSGDNPGWLPALERKPLTAVGLDNFVYLPQIIRD